MTSYHAWTHRPKYLGGTDPIRWASAVHEIKVFEDINDVLAGDDAFIWEVPEDLDGCLVVKVAGFLSTPGGGDCEVAIRLGAPGGGSDILTDPIVIEAGDYNSKDATTQPTVIDGTIANWGDHMHIDVDAAAGKGLGIHVFYHPNAQAAIRLEGTPGPPGGVTQFQGDFDTGTTYQPGDIVLHDGVVYVVTNTTTTTEPGVTPGWEAFFAPLFETAVYSGLNVVMHGGGFQLDTGIKAYTIIPFDCTIVEATLLADQSGSAVVDLWKDTYGAHPPTNADSITSATPPTLSSSIKTTDTSLSGWTTSLNAGDVLAVVVESVSQIGFLTLALRVQRV